MALAITVGTVTVAIVAAAVMLAIRALHPLYTIEDESHPAVITKNQTGKCDIAALCAEHITLDNSKSADPIPANVAAYDKAYAEYTKVVETLSPLYK